MAYHVVDIRRHGIPGMDLFLFVHRRRNLAMPPMSGSVWDPFIPGKSSRDDLENPGMRRRGSRREHLASFCF